jgi:predicted amidohydrolase
MAFRAALVQLRSGPSVEANWDVTARLIRLAAVEGATYVQTPENTNLIQPDRAAFLATVRTEADDMTLASARALAAELGIWLHLGSLAIALPNEARTANRAFLIGPDGRVRARYDKLHMFDVDLPTGESHRESAKVRPGTSATVVDVPFARIALGICYDVRFPQLARRWAKAGANVISYPAAFTVPTGEAHWHVLLRARAIETGSFVLAAAQGGDHGGGRATYGHSLIVDPWGRILGELGTEPGIAVADIDPALSTDARARIPALRHDRAFRLAVVGSAKAGA